jgi:sortase A
LRYSVSKTKIRFAQVQGWLTRIERVFRFAGIVLLIFYLGARSYSIVFSRIGLWQFQAAQTASVQASATFSNTTQGETLVDFSLWSPKRIQAFRQSLALKLDPPIAVLRIPRLQLTAPVFDGTDDLTLNRGLGRIPGTGQPGEGNLAVAGHRDGFFRGLKDIGLSDTIEIVTPTETDTYLVEQTEIVTPDELSVLGPRPTAVLTLVTCYPFYFVGDAPRRFIVEARLKERNVQKQTAVLPTTYRKANPQK